MEQRSELNPELFDMVKAGKLSGEKILSLIQLKNLVDSYATKPFLEQEKMEEIKNKFGVYPDIITWGDYFQTEIGSKFFDLSDEKFQGIVDTIRFDLVSSYLIFQGKPDSFKDKIRTEALLGKSMDSYLTNMDGDESIHLEILLEYYENMGLGNKPLPLSEKIWYETFDLRNSLREAI